jgi:hypothetical protein
MSQAKEATPVALPLPLEKTVAAPVAVASKTIKKVAQPKPLKHTFSTRNQFRNGQRDVSAEPIAGSFDVCDQC